MKMDIFKNPNTEQSKLVISIAQEPDFHFNFVNLLSAKFYDSIPITTTIYDPTDSGTIGPLRDLYDQIASGIEYNFLPLETQDDLFTSAT